MSHLIFEGFLHVKRFRQIVCVCVFLPVAEVRVAFLLQVFQNIRLTKRYETAILHVKALQKLWKRGVRSLNKSNNVSWIAQKANNNQHTSLLLFAHLVPLVTETWLHFYVPTVQGPYSQPFWEILISLRERSTSNFSEQVWAWNGRKLLY